MKSTNATDSRIQDAEKQLQSLMDRMELRLKRNQKDYDKARKLQEHISRLRRA